MKIAYVNKVDGYLSYVGREVGTLGRLVGNQELPTPKERKQKEDVYVRKKWFLSIHGQHKKINFGQSDLRLHDLPCGLGHCGLRIKPPWQNGHEPSRA